MIVWNDKLIIELVEDYRKTINIIKLFENNVNRIINIDNRFILVYRKIYYCIYIISDYDYLFFRIKYKKKMKIKINEEIEYDDSIEFENQNENVKTIIMSLHNKNKQDIEFDDESRVIKEISTFPNFQINCDIQYYSDGWLTRNNNPQKIYKIIGV